MTASNDRSAEDEARLSADETVIGLASAPIEVRVRRAVALLVPTFALGGLFAVLSDEGPATGWPTTITVLVLLSTVPAGLIVTRASIGFSWWDRPHGRPLGTPVFILYADLGVTIVLLMFSDRETAMYGVSLLAIVSTYVAHYASWSTVIMHSVYSTIVIVMFAALTLQQGGHDWQSVAARAVVTWLVVNATLTLTSRFATQLKKTLLVQVTKAHTDPLTSLLNVRGLEIEATNMVRRSTGPVGFMLIDLDMFKIVNDRHGHLVGDAVLELAAERLRTYMGDRGVIARRGGEEFLVVVDTDIHEMLHLAESVRHTLHNPVDDVPVTVSIGVSVVDQRDHPGRTTVDELITLGVHTADVAMYRAKSDGRNRVAAFDSAREEPTSL